MRYLLLQLLAIVTTASAEKSMILDDFTSRNGTNRLGCSWYYYSDVNDGGNSIILNAEPKEGGAFSGILYDTVEDTTNWCGRLGFILGDRKVIDFKDPFVGIGTDLTDSSVDLTGITAVRFRVRSIPAINFIFELETSDITDYAYYHHHLSASEDWCEYIVHIDSTDMSQPSWLSEDSEIELPEVIKHVRKFNWKIFSSENRSLDTAGFLMIDIVFIEGIDSIPSKDHPVNLAGYAASHQSRRFIAPHVYDLSGRRVSAIPGFYNIVPGTHILHTPSTVRSVPLSLTGLRRSPK